MEWQDARWTLVSPRSIFFPLLTLRRKTRFPKNWTLKQVANIKFHIFCSIPHFGIRELIGWDYSNTRGESSSGERGEEDRCLVARKMLPRFFHSEDERFCYVSGRKKWDRGTLASLRQFFLVIRRFNKKFHLPGQGQIISEAVMLVTKQFYMETST